VNKGRRSWKIPPGSWLTLAFLVLASSMLASTFTLSRPSAWVPRIMLSTTLGLLLWQLVAELRSPADRAKGSGGRRARAAGAWICLLLALAWLLGAVAGSAAFCLCWLRWHAGERWLTSLVVALALGLALWVFFGVLPGTPLYPGAIFRFFT
jgi:hypothetical protein